MKKKQNNKLSKLFKKIINCSICKCPIEKNNSNINLINNYIRPHSNLKDSNINDNNEIDQKFFYIWYMKCKYEGYVIKNNLPNPNNEELNKNKSNRVKLKNDEEDELKKILQYN